MPKAVIKSNTKTAHRGAAEQAMIARAFAAEQPVMAEAFQRLESPIAQLRYAAILAERAAEAIEDSSDEIECARYVVRHVARVAHELEELYMQLAGEACRAGHAAMA